MKRVPNIADYVKRAPREPVITQELASHSPGHLHQDVFALVEDIGGHVARLIEKGVAVEPHDRLYEVLELPGDANVRFTYISKESLRENKVAQGPFYQKKGGLFVPFEISLELDITYTVATEQEDRDLIHAHLDLVENAVADCDETGHLDLIDLQAFIRNFKRRKKLQVANVNLSNHKLVKHGREHALAFDFCLEGIDDETTVEWTQPRTLAPMDIKFSLEGEYDLNVESELWPADPRLSSPTLHQAAFDILKKIQRTLQGWKDPQELEK